MAPQTLPCSLVMSFRQLCWHLSQELTLNLQSVCFLGHMATSLSPCTLSLLRVGKE